ncbi:MAG: hypothetical protein PHD74_02065 [Candidatus Krumholzibacteria bacterium]|nr:hypothetical protein [Candidatus Krumholzibacteria bacterium]
MLKRILLSGILGGVVLLLWTLILNTVFGFTARVEMGGIANERAVYSILKENVTAPGAYMANPEPVPGVGFPPGEPVYGIRYSGIGHEAAGRMLFVEPAIVLVAAILVAWLLSMTSRRILSRYFSKVLFVFVVGLLLAVFGDIAKIGIGGYAAKTSLLLAARDVISWTLAGLVIARFMRAPAEAADAA